MNGRCYSGHYKGHYLKSTLEYIYAKYLDHMEVKWDYEIKTFQLSNGGSYKPDFYLTETSQFVEIKGGFNLNSDLPKIKIFEIDNDCKVVILQEKDLRKLIKNTSLVFERLKQDWISQARVFGLDTSGKNNPRYGVTFSESTKQKISDKAKERMSDPLYKAKWVEAQNNSVKVQENIKRLAQSAIDSKLEIKPVKAICLYCQTNFTLETYAQIYTKQQYCSRKCGIRSHRAKTGINNVAVIKKLALDYAKFNPDKIMSSKLSKIKDTLDCFYTQVHEATGITDIRTICVALLGSSSNRKELLRYFQSLVENLLRANANTEALELEDKELLG